MNFGGDIIIGQSRVKEELVKILQSGRIHHSYLFSGPTGVGKKALAVAFAESIIGISNITDLGDDKKTEKRSWFHHPDIRLFIPLPSKIPIDELRLRTVLLSEDPYNIVDFGLRPWISDDGDSKNRRAFYSVEYFKEYIQKVAYLKPHESGKNIIIITNIETMRPEVSNAFLKILEEPPDNLFFLLTTDRINSVIPTILSRCHLIKCSGIPIDEIQETLVQKGGLSVPDASYLAKISGGNYSLTRFYDIEILREIRKDVIRFLRFAYSQDASGIIEIISGWANSHNLEGYISIINTIEVFLRDILIFSNTRSVEAITNSDQAEFVGKFCDSLKSARMYDMVEVTGSMRAFIYQNANIRVLFTVLAIRLGFLMRGMDTFVNKDEPWKHIPAFVTQD